MTPTRRPDTPLARLARGSITTPAGCREWQGATSTGGYAKIREGGKGTPVVGAHRLAWRLLVGPIPPGMHLDHLCRNRRCWEVSHLEVVTPAENVRRALPYRQAPESCPAGHAYTPENSYKAPRGDRRCRACNRERSRVLRQATPTH